MPKPADTRVDLLVAGRLMCLPADMRMNDACEFCCVLSHQEPHLKFQKIRSQSGYLGGNSSHELLSLGNTSNTVRSGARSCPCCVPTTSAFQTCQKWDDILPESAQRVSCFIHPKNTGRCGVRIRHLSTHCHLAALAALRSIL